MSAFFSSGNDYHSDRQQRHWVNKRRQQRGVLRILYGVVRLASAGKTQSLPRPSAETQALEEVGCFAAFCTS